MNIIYLFIILNLIYLINGLIINNYTFNNDNNLIISGNGFSYQTLVKFNYQDIIAIPISVTENEIQVTLPTIIENCEFHVFDSDEERSNSFYLELTPIITSFGNRFEDDDNGNSNVILTWYGQYIWANKDINQFKIIVVNNDDSIGSSGDSSSKIECNEIKNKSVSLQDQMIECSIGIKDIFDIKSKLKAIFTIGGINLINEFSISTPSIESITQKDSSILIIGKDLGSGIQLLDSSINSIKVFNNDKEISIECNNLELKNNNNNNNNGDIECYIGSIVKELEFDGSLNIKINSRGYLSNQINLNIQPFIYTNENIEIYPLGDQNITLNYYYYQFKNQEINNNNHIKVYLIMNQRNGECENIQIINSNQLQCTLPQLFNSIYLSIKISINDIETNSVSIISYLEPSLQSVERLNDNQIKINGNNLISSASLSYLYQPLNCTSNSSNALTCNLNNCNDLNCFSTCGIIIYNDYTFSSTLNYYSSPIIYSANFHNEYLMINASINCSSITQDNYFESDIFAYVNCIRYSFTFYEAGLFKFLYDYPSSNRLDLFDIIFSIKGTNSTFQYNKIFDSPPIISSSKLVNNKIIIDGNALTTNAKITYLDQELSCQSIQNTGDYYSYRLECSIPSSINLNSITQCGIINYSDKHLKTSSIFLIEPSIYDCQIVKSIDKYTGQSYLSYVDINGTINCNEIPPQQYNHLNLIVKLDNNLVPFNYYKDTGIFRFNFVNKQLPIQDKSSFEISLSNSYYELNSNTLIINGTDILKVSDLNPPSTINNSYKLSQSNILNSIIIIIIVSIIAILK